MACGPFSAFLKQLQRIRPALMPRKEPGLSGLAALAKEFEIIDEVELSDGKALEVKPKTGTESLSTYLAAITHFSDMR